jgi:serine/threonine kinase 16
LGVAEIMGLIWSFIFGSRSVSVNGENYKVLRRIGEGGFSYVDLVRGRDGQFYAMKRLLLQVEEQRTALDGEVRAHGLVSHANVLPLVDSEVVQLQNGDSRAYLLFPFYRNGTLEDEIESTLASGRFISEDRILNLFVSVCHAINSFHTCASGVLAHRDVKPGNMLLTEDKEELVLMDLGSVASGHVTISSRQEAIALQDHCAQTCTAMYRAPELFEVPSECVITVKTDIWSLGCSIYAAAFGTSPCDGSALSAMSGRIMFPRNHSYSQSFCNLITWMLKVDPVERPTIQEVEYRIGTILYELTNKDV